LNAEPGADAAFPGCIVETSQEESGFWLGWPLIPPVCGSRASATLPSVQHTTIANMVINLVFIPVESKRRWFADRTAKVTTLLLFQNVDLGYSPSILIFNLRVEPRPLAEPAVSCTGRTPAIGL